VWPSGGEDPAAGCKVEEGYGWRVELDIKSILSDIVLTKDDR
jgi:hypothetical protein